MKSEVLKSFFKNNKRYDLQQESELGQGLLEGISIQAMVKSIDIPIKIEMGSQTLNSLAEETRNVAQQVIREVEALQEVTLDKQDYQIQSPKSLFDENVRDLTVNDNNMRVSCSNLRRSSKIINLKQLRNSYNTNSNIQSKDSLIQQSH